MSLLLTPVCRFIFVADLMLLMIVFCLLAFASGFDAALLRSRLARVVSVPDPVFETDDDFSVVAGRFLDDLAFHRRRFVELVAERDNTTAVDAEAHYADPTVAEFLGVIASYFSRGSDRRLFRDDMEDCAQLQALEWVSFRRLVAWVEIPSYLHMARERLLRKMSKFELFRMQRRFTHTYRRDLGFVNLGEKGEMFRFLQLKMVNELVATPLVRFSTEEARIVKVYEGIQSQLGALLTPGQIRTAQAKGVERYARAKLRLEYALAAQLYAQQVNLTNMRESIDPIVEDVLERSVSTLISITAAQAQNFRRYSSLDYSEWSEADVIDEILGPRIPRSKVARQNSAPPAEVEALLIRNQFNFTAAYNSTRVASAISKGGKGEKSFSLMMTMIFFFFFFFRIVCLSRL